jgi:hypothetical protein
MTLETCRYLLSKPCDHKTWIRLKNTETGLLKRKINQSFNEAAHRTFIYRDFKLAMDYASQLRHGYGNYIRLGISSEEYDG